MKKIRWTKYRVLVTNKCNYRCPFCHNEGQDKSTKNDFMTLEDFKMLVDLLTTEDIEELNISGGEPFINKHIVNMIEYADTHLKCDISCATNLSLISQSQIKRLARTRVKLNIQFPYVDEESFKESTGNGNKDTILQNIKLCKEANVDVGLNTVVQNADVQKYERIILFAIDNEIPLKLLPQIGNRESYKYKDFIIPILNRYSVDFKDKKSGALKWSLKKDGHFTSVLYIDSPCFYNDIKTCRNFAELRIHPNLAAQTCILKDSTIKLQFNQGFQLVKNQLRELWNNFTIC